MAVTLVLWLAFLLSAALTSIGLLFPDLTASNAQAATIACSATACGTATSTDYSFTSPVNSWAVLGARSTASTGDPRVCLYTDGSYTTTRACSNFSSALSAVEFVVVDGHHAPAGTVFARADKVTGSGELCTQLDCGATTLVPGMAPVVQSWAAGDVVRAYNVPVTAGGLYRADLVVTSGTANFGLALFDSQGQAGYAADRGQAVTGADRRGTGQGEGIYFTAAPNDTLGLVLFGSNAGATANFRIEVRSATALVSGVPLSMPGEGQHDYLTVPTATRDWAVLALRPGAANTDADLRQYDAPDYLGLVGKSSAVPGAVDFVLTDYAHTPEDTTAALMISLGPLGGYLIEWLEHPAVLVTSSSTALSVGGHIGLAREVALSAGVEYQFVFDPTDGSTGDLSLGLYGPTPAKPNFTYGTRADSLAGSDIYATKPTGWTAGDGIEQFVYTPGISGSFLLYAYQKTSADASGDLRFFPTSLLGVGDGPRAPRPVLSAAWPSPARAGEAVRFRCELPAAGAARLAIVDVRGRTVATAFHGELPAGPSELAWDGRADDGARVGPGMYFARLTGPGGVAVRSVVWLR